MTDPRQYEIRITWVGGGPLVVRGILAWFILKLTEQAGAGFQEHMNTLHSGHLEADWGDNGGMKVKAERTWNLPGRAA